MVSQEQSLKECSSRKVPDLGRGEIRDLKDLSVGAHLLSVSPASLLKANGYWIDGTLDTCEK